MLGGHPAGCVQAVHGLNWWIRVVKSDESWNLRITLISQGFGTLKLLPGLWQHISPAQYGIYLSWEFRRHSMLGLGHWHPVCSGHPERSFPPHRATSGHQRPWAWPLQPWSVLTGPTVTLGSRGHRQGSRGDLLALQQAEQLMLKRLWQELSPLCLIQAGEMST